MQAGGGGEQRGGAGRGGGGEHLFGALHRALLVEIRCHQPLVQVERVAGGGEDGAAVDDAERAVHAEAKPLEHGGKVPGIDRLSVDRGLAAHRLEPGAVQKRRQQRMTGERLVEPGEAPAAYARAPASAGSSFSRCRPQQCVEHFFHPRRTAASAAREAPRLAWPCATDPRRINGLRARLRKPGDSVQQPCYLFRPPFPGFVCPIRPLVGHSNLGHPGAA